MGQKDLYEKSLISFNDVAADLVNVLLYDGQHIVDESELEDADPHLFYVDDEIRLRERDVIKKWTKDGEIQGFFAFENQTAFDRNMVVRTMQYDSLNYRKQEEANIDGIIYPVYTIVLFFDEKKHWNSPAKLSDRVKVGKYFKSIFKDYALDIFNIFEFTDEIIGKCKSDIGVFFDFIIQISKTGVYNGSRKILRHGKFLLYAMYSWTGNKHFLEMIDDENYGEEFTMCKWIDDLCERSVEEGIAKGKTEGIELGLAKGKAEGKAEGIAEGLFSTAKNMLNADFPVNVIANMTGLSEAEIMKLQKA